MGRPVKLLDGTDREGGSAPGEGRVDLRVPADVTGERRHLDPGVARDRDDLRRLPVSRQVDQDDRVAAVQSWRPVTVFEVISDSLDVVAVVGPEHQDVHRLPGPGAARWSSRSAEARDGAEAPDVSELVAEIPDEAAGTSDDHQEDDQQRRQREMTAEEVPLLDRRRRPRLLDALRSRIGRACRQWLTSRRGARVRGDGRVTGQPVTRRFFTHVWPPPGPAQVAEYPVCRCRRSKPSQRRHSGADRDFARR